MAEVRVVDRPLPVLRFGGPGEADEGEDGGGTLALDLGRLVSSRLLVQAQSGGGKSWALRALLEGTHGLIQQLVFDWEGEFGSLRERFGYVLAGQDGDVPAAPETAAALCRRLLELHASAVLDLSALRVEGRQAFVGAFLDALMGVERALWRPLLVVIDEAHLVCPEVGQGEAASRQSVIDLCTLGRKRGFCAVLATQRIAKVSNNALAELGNVLIGPTSFAPDVRRAADTLGWEKRQSERLKVLEPGQFAARGPALSREVVLVRTGAVVTSHPSPGQIAPPAPPAPDAIRALLEQLGDVAAAPGPSPASGVGCEHLDELAMLHAEIRGLVEDRAEALAALEGERARRAAADGVLTETLTRGVSWALSEVLAGVEASRATLEAMSAAAVSGRLLENSAGGPPPPAEGVAAVSAAGCIPGPSSEPDAAPRVVAAGGEPAATASDASAAVPRGMLLERGAGERVLDAIATLAGLGVREPNRIAVAALADMAWRGGHFQRVVGTLVREGLVVAPSSRALLLTAEGAALARAMRVDSIRDFHSFWLARVSGAPEVLLRELLLRGAGEVPREHLARWAGLAAKGGHFQRAVGELRDLGAVEALAGGMVRASRLLFPPGLG